MSINPRYDHRPRKPPKEPKPPKPKAPYKGPRMAVPGEYEGDPPLYVAEKIYLGITKKVQIERAFTKGRIHYVEYTSKGVKWGKGGSRGVLALYDLGPGKGAASL